MKTWKTKKTVCRSRKSGKFASGGHCRAYRRTRVRLGLKTLFTTILHK